MFRWFSTHNPGNFRSRDKPHGAILMPSPLAQQTLPARIFRAATAWMARGPRRRRLRRVEADLRDFSRHVRRDIGLDI
jgi:hypothetical protein